MWQPIETAPRDGTLVDLWADYRHPNCFYFEGFWYSLWASHGGIIKFDAIQPTHWMPIPKGPNNDTD